MWLLSVHPWFNCGAAHINYDPSNRLDKEVGEEKKNIEHILRETRYVLRSTLTESCDVLCVAEVAIL